MSAGTGEVAPVGAALPGAVASASGPIFVTGLNRSGKSLLSMLLSSHAHIAIPRRESRFWTTIHRRFGDLGVAANFERCLKAMLVSHDWGQSRLEPERLRERFRCGPPTYERLYAAFHEEYAALSGKRRWGAHGQRLEDLVDFLLEAFPGARVIHVTRDPRDGCAALRATERRLGRRHWPGQFAVHAERWLRSTRLAAGLARRHPDAYLVLPYESLATDPQSTADAICRFLGEPAIPNARKIPDLWNLQGGAGDFELSAAHVGSYRRELSRREIWYLQSRLEGAMVAQGYQAEPVKLSAFEHIVLVVKDWPVYQARLALFRLRKGLRSRRAAASPS